MPLRSRWPLNLDTWPGNCRHDRFDLHSDGDWSESLAAPTTNSRPAPILFAFLQKRRNQTVNGMHRGFDLWR